MEYGSGNVIHIYDDMSAGKNFVNDSLMLKLYPICEFNEKTPSIINNYSERNPILVSIRLIESLMILSSL